MSCIGVKISKVSRCVNIAASLAYLPFSTLIVPAYNELSVEICADETKTRYNITAAYTPIEVRVSQVCSLGKINKEYELFCLADGKTFLLSDGKTFKVVKYGRIQK